MEALSIVRRDPFWGGALALAGEARAGRAPLLPLCLGCGGCLQTCFREEPLHDGAWLPGQQSFPLGSVASLGLPWSFEARVPGFLPFLLLLGASSGFSGHRGLEVPSPYFYLFSSHLPHPSPYRLRGLP